MQNQKKIFRKVPCALMKHDWLDRSKTGFCIDLKKCDLRFNATQQQEASDLCFSFAKGPRNYIYIREDLLKPKPKPKKIPPNPQEIPEKPEKTQKTKSCPEGKILNPASGRCVDINGKIGKQLSSKA
jgi:hypothetical protein